MNAPEQPDLVNRWLARALIKKPEVFVLDEPISHLDTRQRGRMRAYLKRLHIELGHTMVYVTHDQDEAMAMADRITVMRDGHLIQTGTPEGVYNHPLDIFVAGFIGEPAMNFLNCRFVSDADEYYLEAMADPQIRLPIPEDDGRPSASRRNPPRGNPWDSTILRSPIFSGRREPFRTCQRLYR